jgi:tRNA dimethylallyltransferase
MNKLIVILGPTASGKTSLATKLAKRFQGEIVSADSRQIYKEMNIGTDKIQNPDIPHYLIDIVRPDQEFTLAQYKRKAVKAIKDIQQRGKIPFLVGGTGLYIQAVVDNLKVPEVKPNPQIRQKLEQKNNEELFEELKQVDPKATEFIDPHNKRRIIRALEVYQITGKPFSKQRQKGKPFFDFLEIGIDLNKEILKEKIDKRVEEMIEQGLIKEVRKLLEKYNPSIPAMSGIGYAEAVKYIREETTLEETKEEIKKNTWRYSRRQISWFRQDKRIHWLNNYTEAKKIVKRFLK